MALVRHTTGGALTPEKQAGMKAEIDAATKRPYAYDPDVPLLTEKQLSELRPVNFTTMEERAWTMEQKSPALAVSK